jgi:hypothetical protein
MDHSEVIETIGSITKMESVISIEQSILENSLVLKNIDPFPGFRKEKEKKSEYVTLSFFIILKNRYTSEKINSIIWDLASDKLVIFYPSIGEIITQSSIYSCIRIKGIKDLNQILNIQTYIYKHGLELMEYQNINCWARIKIFKTFKLVEIADGLYRDLNEGEKIYIRISNSMNWKDFERITKNVKYKLKNRNFDSALGIIYRFCGPEDVIRVFDEEKTLERALLIKKMYFKEINDNVSKSVHNLQHD